MGAGGSGRGGAAADNNDDNKDSESKSLDSCFSSSSFESISFDNKEARQSLEAEDPSAVLSVPPAGVGSGGSSCRRGASLSSLSPFVRRRCFFFSFCFVSFCCLKQGDNSRLPLRSFQERGRAREERRVEG